MGSPIQLFASAGHRAGALFENRSAGIAEIGLALPQALLDPGRIGNVASAEPEGVGRTGGPLLGGARDSPAQRRVSHKAMLPPLRYSDVLFSKSYLITPLIDLGFRSEAGLPKKPGSQQLAALTKS
jgi:hypothetical protein